MQYDFEANFNLVRPPSNIMRTNTSFFSLTFREKKAHAKISIVIFIEVMIS